MNPKTKKALWTAYIIWLLGLTSISVWGLVLCLRVPQIVTFECPTNGTCTAETVQILQYRPCSTNSTDMCESYIFDCQKLQIVNVTGCIAANKHDSGFCDGSPVSLALLLISSGLLILTLLLSLSKWCGCDWECDEDDGCFGFDLDNV